MTLTPGKRTEALGPLFYGEQTDTRRTWAIPPVLSYSQDPDTESQELDFLYPVMTYERYGAQYRWQLFQLLSFGGGPTQQEEVRTRFTIFPLYFQQRSSDSDQNYTAVVPFYGHLKNRLFREEIFFVMFPFYSHTRKADVVTDNYVYPFFHLRHGEALEGWQFWPLIGHEHKDVTSRTNAFGEIQTVGGHDKFFALWPFYFNQQTGIGTENPVRQQGLLPLYSLQRSPNRGVTTLLWPFFSVVDEREKHYREWEVPWPLIIFAHGEGKTTRRVWPFFSRAHNATLESDFYLWPLYKYNRVHSPPLERERTRILFFLYSDLTQKNTETGAAQHRVDLWPLYTQRRDWDGSKRLQVLAPLEPLLPRSHKIERDYSPIWSVWRSERNARTGASSQSLLWNLFRRSASPTSRKWSLLFGLFQSEADSAGKRLRLFYIPIRHGKAPEFENFSDSEATAPLARTSAR